MRGPALLFHAPAETGAPVVADPRIGISRARDLPLAIYPGGESVCQRRCPSAECAEAIDRDTDRTDFPRAMNASKQRVLLGMSGGVDSSVAGFLLREQGYDVIGVTMKVWPQDCISRAEDKCCGPQAVADARGVAHSLGFPHYVVDEADQFERLVIDYFSSEYQAGRTPNPCVMCNEKLKFGNLWKKPKRSAAITSPRAITPSSSIIPIAPFCAKALIREKTNPISCSVCGSRTTAARFDATRRHVETRPFGRSLAR